MYPMTSIVNNYFKVRKQCFFKRNFDYILISVFEEWEILSKLCAKSKKR